jgi:UDPglucose 6-dehydrogenase
VKIAENAGYDFALLRGVIEVNEQQYLRIVEKIMTTQKDHLSEFRVTVLGLTFKAGTDDRRDSPALFIARLLQKRGAVVNAYDPTVKADTDSSDLIGIQLFESAYDALAGSDVMAVLTEWEEIKGIEPVQVWNLMRSKVVVDARNVLNKDAWQSNGFNYLGVGR